MALRFKRGQKQDDRSSLHDPPALEATPGMTKFHFDEQYTDLNVYHSGPRSLYFRIPQDPSSDPSSLFTLFSSDNEFRGFRDMERWDCAW